TAFSFFFQAEDGIRAFHVTGVQTCALPISIVDARLERQPPCDQRGRDRGPAQRARRDVLAPVDREDEPRDRVALARREEAERERSEERRVGKEGRSGGSAEPSHKDETGP